jgi:hypothetical protein
MTALRILLGTMVMAFYISDAAAADMRGPGSRPVPVFSKTIRKTTCWLPRHISRGLKASCQD